MREREKEEREKEREREREGKIQDQLFFFKEFKKYDICMIFNRHFQIDTETIQRTNQVKCYRRNIRNIHRERNTRNRSNAD